MVSNSTDLKVVCNNKEIIHSHKIIFGLIHVSLAEIFIQDEFTDQKVTIFLPIDSEDLKIALKFDSIEDSTNIINNIFKVNSDPEPSKQENNVSTVKLEGYDIEDFVSECINESEENVNFEDVFQKEIESIENEKKMVKKVRLADILISDVEDFSETQDEKLQNKESLKRKRKQGRVVKVNGKYECGQCHKTYSRSMALYIHIQSRHEGVKYECDQCNYQATQKSHLTLHIKSQHEGIRYDCDQCDYQATRQSSLTLHIQSKHEGIRYACDKCDYQATRQSNLIAHIQSKHEGVKYACHQCDYQATTQSSLTVHIKSKHEIVKYACNQCDYQATTQGVLTVHIQTKHEGVRYNCKQCDYQATQQASLRRHVQSIHEGVKYACDQCDQQYTEQGNLGKHIKKKHVLPTNLRA